MHIPLTFYFNYWIKNTLLAISTGLLISFLIPPLFALVPYLPLIFCALYQVVILNNYFGKRDVDFEYHYMENLITKKSNQFVKVYLGWGNYFVCLLDKINNVISTAWDIHQKLSCVKEVDESEEFHFYTNIIGADLSRKEDDISREKSFLQHAIRLKPNDLVTNYRLAVVYEREGFGKDAIEKYKAAMNDPRLSLKRLRDYISNQISRINEFGPKKSPPMPGFKYMA